ncbi:MAG: hypothetical protein A2Y78_06230 [Acidobacteria bacterium RBG_13_68_16]|nr:MAG: hypothetical protein A2Y78_06230 [Acidobacteria bacterium RBG_13_68_16]
MLNRRQFMAAATQPVGAAAALAFLHPRRAVAIATVASRHPGTADEIDRFCKGMDAVLEKGLATA